MMNHRSIGAWLLVAGAAFGGAGAVAQPLYSNGSSSPGVAALGGRSASSAGVAAPNLGEWSEPASEVGGGANGLLGISAHPSVDGGHRLADDFFVSAASGWIIDSVQVFAYVPDWSGNGAAFASGNLRIWRGVPGEPGSVLMLDGVGSNQLAAAYPLNIWRIYEQSTNPVAAVPDQRRRLWQLEFSMNRLILPQGEYWLDWQLVPTTAGAAVFCPPVTTLGARTSAASNARQFGVVDGVLEWTPVIDTGKPLGVPDYPQDFPFVVVGVVVPPPCLSDFDGDLFLSQEDLTGFLTAFLSEPSTPGPGGFAVPCAGLAAPYDAGFQIDINRDCAGDQEDLSLFITSFFDGCP